MNVVSSSRYQLNVFLKVEHYETSPTPVLYLFLVKFKQQEVLGGRFCCSSFSGIWNVLNKPARNNIYVLKNVRS